MKLIATTFILLSAAILVGVAVSDYQQLPDKIASHFNANGSPNGWSSSAAFTRNMIAMGLGISASIMAIMYSIRFFPAKLLNVPNPVFWRQPRNYRKACDFLFVSSLWLGGLFLLWQTCFSHLIVAANQSSPPHLDGAKTVVLTMAILVILIGWVAVLVWRFLHVESDEP